MFQAIARFATAVVVGVAAMGAGCAGRSAPVSAPVQKFRPEVREADAARILEEVRRTGARAVLVNVWATWCVPCQEEFPDLMKLNRRMEPRGLRVILVSADFGDGRDEQIRRFLEEHRAGIGSFVKPEGRDQEFIDALEPRWSGAIPVTMIYDSSGTLRDIEEGSATYSQLKDKVLRVMRQDGPGKEGS